MACKTPGGGNYHTKRTEVVFVPLRGSKSGFDISQGVQPQGSPAGTLAVPSRHVHKAGSWYLLGSLLKYHTSTPVLPIWESSVRLGGGGGGRGKRIESFG